jgi:hypothetical protein
MADNDTSEGPQIGQVVLYNSGTTGSPTIVPAVIYAVSATTGSVSLTFFNASGATNVATSNYDSGVGTGSGLIGGRWQYMLFV